MNNSSVIDRLDDEQDSGQQDAELLDLTLGDGNETDRILDSLSARKKQLNQQTDDLLKQLGRLEDRCARGRQSPRRKASESERSFESGISSSEEPDEDEAGQRLINNSATKMSEHKNHR